MEIFDCGSVNCMEQKEQEIRYLLQLLDDEDQPAGFAMADLLQRDCPELDHAIRSLQDCTNPRLRRRIHQLEVILRRRRARHLFIQKLEEKNLSLFEGCLELHLSWFDNDSADSVTAQWNELKKEVVQEKPDSLSRMAAFMRQQKFQVPERDQMDAEYFCIGNVIDEERTGSDLMLSVIACLLAEEVGLHLEVIRRGPDFGLTDCTGGFILPASGGWTVVNRVEMEVPCVVWRRDEILKFIAALLYLCAVGTDSFRYIYTLGMNLAADARLPDLKFLPYPYAMDTRTKGQTKG